MDEDITDTTSPRATDFTDAIDNTGARDVRYEREVVAGGPTYRAAPVPPTRTVEETDERVVATAEPPRFSIAAGFYGWAVAMWFTLLFTGVVLAFLGNAAYNNSTITGNTVSVSQVTLNDLATGGVIGGLLAVLVAFFLGGYAAGRIGRWNGALQGAMVVVWTVVFGIIGAVIANVAASNVNLGAYLTTYRIDWGAVTTNTVVTLGLMLVVMLAGAVFGGTLGDNYHANDYAVERTRTFERRGRPL